jgi:hypothetical protein
VAARVCAEVGVTRARACLTVLADAAAWVVAIEPPVVCLVGLVRIVRARLWQERLSNVTCHLLLPYRRSANGLDAARVPLRATCTCERHLGMTPASSRSRLPTPDSRIGPRRHERPGGPRLYSRNRRTERWRKAGSPGDGLRRRPCDSSGGPRRRYPVGKLASSGLSVEFVRAGEASSGPVARVALTPPQGP